jgi:uncharacterized protein
LTLIAKYVILFWIYSKYYIAGALMIAPKHPFRFNVGFIVAEQNGYRREFPVEFSEVRLQDLELKDVAGSVTFTRTTQGLLTQVRMTAQYTSECMRCLEPFDLTLSPEFTEVYAFSKNSITDSGLILPETGQVDLEPLVREYMLLEIPIKPVCKLDCKGLCPVCGENQNEHTCQHEEETFDPRLSVLQTLLESKKPT